MPSVPLHSGNTRTRAPVARASLQYVAGSSAIPVPRHAAAIKTSKLPLARRGSTGTLLISPFSAVSSSLFDHLVGAGEERLGHGKVECLSRGQVDDEIELGRLLDRNFGWVCPA